jgi:hypothetical protein
MRLKVILGTAMLAGLLCANLSAAPITGTFNVAGNVTVTAAAGGNTVITFNQLLTNIVNMANIGATVTGDFAAPTNLAFAPIMIMPLTSATEPALPPGGLFPPQTFITFLPPAPAGFSSLLDDHISIGVFSNTQCLVAPAVGQTCTPSGLPGFAANSALNLTNQEGVGGSINSTASFALSGVTADGQAIWTGVLSANFTTPYQTVLAAFAANGSVTNTYSGTFTLTPIPEAGTMSLLGLGLVGLSMRLRRRKA